MARKAPQQAAAPQPAQLSATQMQAAIPKLRRRLDEIAAFDPTSAIDVGDPNAGSIKDKINDTLVDIFGHESIEYKRYSMSSLYAGAILMGGMSRQHIVRGYHEGKERAIAKLRTAISLIEEKLSDLSVDVPSSAPRALDGFDLHPDIEHAAGALFRDRHYANAIENACKALNARVQMKSGIYNLNEKVLMQTVFSCNNPRLAFNNLIDSSDKSEQEGMMYLYTGVFLAFRNPRAHKLVRDRADRAFDIIRFISLLAKMLDDVKVRDTNT